jgi:Arc/MetJ-type ribon-helix-helix transcriptional regulator
MELPPHSMERLKALREKTEATSYAEVVKNALRLYEAMIEKAEAGNEFLIKDKDGREHQYEIFY